MQVRSEFLEKELASVDTRLHASTKPVVRIIWTVVKPIICTFALMGRLFAAIAILPGTIVLLDSIIAMAPVRLWICAIVCVIVAARLVIHYGKLVRHGMAHGVVDVDSLLFATGFFLAIPVLFIIAS